MFHVPQSRTTASLDGDKALHQPSATIVWKLRLSATSGSVRNCAVLLIHQRKYIGEYVCRILEINGQPIGKDIPFRVSDVIIRGRRVIVQSSFMGELINAVLNITRKLQRNFNEIKVIFETSFYNLYGIRKFIYELLYIFRISTSYINIIHSIQLNIESNSFAIFK